MNATLSIDPDCGLITCGEGECLGYLMDFGPQHGVHDASEGRVEITKEQAERHNKCLDKMMLDGLDSNCEIGQVGTFYWNEKERCVKTFIGTVVAPAKDCVESTQNVWFTRKSKRFRGRKMNDADCINFRRIS